MMMITPYVATVPRTKNRCAVNNLSFRDISRRYFRIEHQQTLIIEIVIFVVLGAIAMWPLCDAALAVHNYLLSFAGT
jgi:hypothetical protein